MGKVSRLVDKDERYFVHSGRIKYYPLVIDHGYGVMLIDIDGKSYIDLLASASSQNVDHAPEPVVEAIKNQTEEFIHYTPAYMYHEPLVRLSKKLCDTAPGNYGKKVTFGLSGSDANDGIIKFTRAYTGRPCIISLANAYHDSTFGLLSISSISLSMCKHYGPLLNGFYHISSPDEYRGMFEQAKPNTVEKYLAPLKEMSTKYVPAEETACIMAGTIQGDGGLLEPIPGYFEALQEFCHAHSTPITVDDIQRGLGRIGRWNSVGHYHFTPGLVTFGRSLAGGLPMFAIVDRKKVMESLEAPAHLFTAGANPVSCEATLATIKTIEDEDLLNASWKKGSYVRKRIDPRIERYQYVGGVRGVGLSIGIDIVLNKIKKTRDFETALRICNYCFEDSMIIIAVADNVLRFQPPLVITYKQLDKALDTIEEVLEKLERGELNQYDISGQG